jgi:phage shock protein PspC (stress-responsive transcriptional regulator)
MFKKIVALMVLVMFAIASLGCGGVTKYDGADKPKLARIDGQGMISGVCAGFAYWTGTPAWAWRAGFVISVACFGFGIGVYLLLWIFMPKFDKTPADYDKRVS